jgi:hypothetical protein
MSHRFDIADKFDAPTTREAGAHSSLFQNIAQDYFRFREAFDNSPLANFLPDLRIGGRLEDGMHGRHGHDHHHHRHGHHHEGRHSRWFSPEFWSRGNGEEMPDYKPHARNDKAHQQFGQAVEQLNQPQQQQNDGRFPTGRGNYPQELLNSVPPGYAGEKWTNPDYHTIKYDVSRNLAQVRDQMHALPDEASKKQFMEDFLKSQIPVIEANGGHVIAIKGEAICLDAGEGGGPHWIDTVADIGEKDNVQWCPVGGDIPPQQNFENAGRGLEQQRPSDRVNTSWSPELLASCPPGFDGGKWSNPDYHTPKYDVSRNLAMVQDQLHAIPDEPGRKAWMENFLKTQVPLIEAQGYKVTAIKNEKIQLSHPSGSGWIDCARDIGGDAAVQWLPV